MKKIRADNENRLEASHPNKSSKQVMGRVSQTAENVNNKTRTLEEQESKRKEFDFVGQNSITQNGAPPSETVSNSNTTTNNKNVNIKPQTDAELKAEKKAEKDFKDLEDTSEKKYFMHILCTFYAHKTKKMT